MAGETDFCDRAESRIDEASAAGILRTIGTLGSLEAELERMRPREPVYGLLVGRWRRSAPPGIALPPLPGGTGFDRRSCGSGWHEDVLADVITRFDCVRETTERDRISEANARNPVLVARALSARIPAHGEPLMEMIGHLGGLYRANVGGILSDGPARTDAFSDWVEAIHARCLPDALWLLEGGAWKRVDVTKDPAVPHVKGYYNLAATSLEAIQALRAEARARLAPSGAAEPEGVRPPGASVADSVVATDTPVLTQSGRTWTASWREISVPLPARLGFGDLSRLLASPHQPISCYELAGQPRPEGARGEEILDSAAFRQFRKRLDDLDGISTDEAEEERAKIRDQIEVARARGGAARRVRSDDDRVRDAVRKRVREAIAAIAASHPDLGKYLGLTILTGACCRYDPDRARRSEKGASGESAG